MAEYNWTWKTDGTLTGQGPVILGEPNYFEDGSPRLIAELETTRYRDNSAKRWKRKDNADEIERIANLISAAPELLEALQWWVERLENPATVSESEAMAVMNEALMKSRAAIAKATGEQS